MFQKNVFRARLAEHNITQTDIADRLHIARGTLSEKVNGHNDFTNNEALAIKNILHLTNEDFWSIFFAD